jgi:hypothetical protein
MAPRRFSLRPLSRLELLGELALILLLRYLWPDAIAAAPISLAFWGVLFSAIVTALGWVGQQAVTLAVTAAQVAVWLGQAIWRVIQATGTAFGRVTNFLERFWSNVLRPFVRAVWLDLQRVYRWVKVWGDRITKAVEKIRARVMAIYDHWFRPIFDAIDVLHETLQLLAMLRIEWARKLDAELLRIREELFTPIRLTMLRLNQAIDWINRIVTLDGTLQRITLLASLWKHAADSWAVLLHRQLAGLDAGQIATMHAREYPEIDPQFVARELAEFYSTGAGALAEPIGAAFTLPALSTMRAEQP